MDYKEMIEQEINAMLAKKQARAEFLSRNMDTASQWIWKSGFSGKDIYCDFYSEFDYSGEGAVTVKISCDSNYTLYINGGFAESGQYPDYPYYKVFDEFDITSHCRKGKNSFAVTVWHYGDSNMSYVMANAGLRYEIWHGETLIGYSKAGDLCRESREYQNGFCKKITPQLGYSYHYDATGDDGWRNGGAEGFSYAYPVEKDSRIFARPVKKLTVGERVECKTLKSEGGVHFLYDIGREEVGYLTLKVKSAVKQKLTVAFGEHIIDGGVRRILPSRDFSVEVTVGEGETTYTNYYRRLGLRYLEVFCDSPIEVEYVSVLPVFYPLGEGKRIELENELDRRIYEVCVRTLELCMHEHYEDCPWREQALYCMDSRNQMLCGYYAFGEYDFPRANLELMSKERRADGLLSICFPSDVKLAIPSFSLHYFTQVYEYYDRSADTDFVKEIYPKLCSIMKAFTSRSADGGCIPSFVGKEYWNFYEWSDGLSGNLGSSDGVLYEAALNFLLVIALRNMSKLAEAAGEKDEFKPLIAPILEDARKRFFCSECGLFLDTEGGKKSELVNALAILSGACSYSEAQYIAKVLASKDSGLTPATLSMLCFKYDAMITMDRSKYAEIILDDIRTKYGKMLDEGATSFWETEDGAAAFGNAGSLCHGWSALPIYYYELLMGEPEYRLYR